MILLVDNYDSFTYNLYQSLAQHDEVEVVRNDSLTVAEALAFDADAYVLSPGPGRPKDAGICLELLAALPADKPLLGVCLGHQALVEHCGGSLEVDAVPMHGKSSAVHFDPDAFLFEGLPNPFEAGRYHSLRATREDLPSCLRLTAWTEDHQVMGVEHRHRPWHGVQFHPESILTSAGEQLLARLCIAVA